MRFLAVPLLVVTLHADPLRVVVSSDTPAFRDPYAAAITEAGGRVAVVADPDAAALGDADVVLLHRRTFEKLPEASLEALGEFAKRGGGIVVVNAAVAAGGAEWGKTHLGGAWEPDRSRKFGSLMMLYVLTDAHPVVRDASSFDVTDDTLYDLALSDRINVIGTAFTPKGRDGGVPESERDLRASIYDIQPQMWTYEGGKHRAAVFLQGANDEAASHPSLRNFVLRALAWTGKRDDADELCKPGELADLRYPPGGPLRAEDAVKRFDMLPGFKATVFAEEPLINKPIAVQWDAAGVLWVAETPEYPNGRRPLVAEPWKETASLEPGVYDRPARDRISRLIDTDGDGKADEKELFHEGLELVTGFCMHDKGVIAVAQPHIVYLADTDGDGKADQEKPLFKGFDPGDTHFVANHFIAAPDGWIYASTGSGASARHPQTDEEMARISPGVFRFKADGSAIQQVASQGGNSFGAEVTSDMEIFHSKATNGNPVQHVALPEWVLARAPGIRAESMHSVNPGRAVNRNDLPDRAPIMQIDQVGRYTAACSVTVYEGGTWPEEYRDTIFMSEPILDVIHHERLVPRGSSYQGELVLQDREWLRSSDYWFCPIAVNLGPDGAMYVLDFYTPVVAHNDTRGPQHSRSNASVRPDRERYFGRIYRIQHKAAPAMPSSDLSQADAAALVAAFRHPNRAVRFNAIRLLIERRDAVGEAETAALRDMVRTDGSAPARIQALWALHRLGKLDEDLLKAAASDELPSLRRNAMLLVEAGQPLSDASVFDALLKDADQRVRLAALRAMSASPPDEARTAVLLANMNRLHDPRSQAAVAAAGAGNPAPLIVGMLDGSVAPGPVMAVARSLAISFSSKATPESVMEVLSAAVASKESGLAAVVIGELGANAESLPDASDEALDVLRKLLASDRRELAAASLPLVITWDKEGALKDGLAAAAKELLPVVRDERLRPRRRTAALRSLVAVRGSSPEIMPALVSLMKESRQPEFRRAVIEALAGTGEASVGEALPEILPTLPRERREPALNAIAGRPEWSMLLLDALDAKRVPAAELDPRDRSRFTNHPDATVASRAKTVFVRLDGGGNPAKSELVARLLPEAVKEGDAAKGKEIFAAACALCHQMDGMGQRFGPNLDGIGSHPVADLLTHIVDPTLVVDDEHRTWNFSMKNGTQFAGIIASENEARVQLRQPGGAVVDLAAADIAERRKADISLMPEGFESLGAEGLRDLITYIREAAGK